MEKGIHPEEKRRPRLRLLHITWDGSIGGAQNFVHSLLKELLKYKELQIEVCFAKQEGPVTERIRRLGIPTHCLNMRNGFDLINAVRLVKLVKRGRYDLLHSHSPQPLVRLAMALAKCRGSLLTEHGSILDDIRGRHKPEVYYHRLLAKFIHSYIAVSASVKRGLMNRHGVPRGKIEIIPTALDLSHFRPGNGDVVRLRKELGLPAKGPVIGSIGRLSPEKGIDHLILATRKVLERFPDCVTLIVGDGNLRGDLEDQVRSLGISKSVFFLGEQTAIARIISLVDVLIMPSVHEGLPLVALESMAMGRPVVGYNVKGISDIITHQSNGLLAEKRDPHLLADQIEILLGNESLRLRMGESGMQRVTRDFNITTIAKRYRYIYSGYLLRSTRGIVDALQEESAS
jgi:glycosyltransferase involved in cell wall biosynthesis